MSNSDKGFQFHLLFRCRFFLWALPFSFKFIVELTRGFHRFVSIFFPTRFIFFISFSSSFFVVVVIFQFNLVIGIFLISLQSDIARRTHVNVMCAMVVVICNCGKDYFFCHFFFLV